MRKTEYELKRDENIREIQDVFNSLGILLKKKEVSNAIPNKEKGKKKTVESDKRDSDTDYDPSSDIDNQSDSDNDSADDLINQVNTEVRGSTRPTNKFLDYLILTCT